MDLYSKSISLFTGNIQTNLTTQEYLLYLLLNHYSFKEKGLLTIGGRTKTGFFHLEYSEESELELSPASSAKRQHEVRPFKPNLYKAIVDLTLKSEQFGTTVGYLYNQSLS